MVYSRALKNGRVQTVRCKYTVRFNSLCVASMIIDVSTWSR